MRIHRAAPADLDSIDALRLALWPDSPIEELKAIVAAQPEYLVLIASEAGQRIGFAEISTRRDYVEGCETSPVAFLEGIYVDPAYRKQGVARALVDEALRWAGEQGLSEFGSDALIDNDASHAFHKAIGFPEVERVVYFHRRVEQAA